MKRILIPATIALLAAVLLAVCFLFSSCSKHTYGTDELIPVTQEEFCRTANALGYFVLDYTGTDKIKEIDNVVSYYTVEAADDTYKIEFVIFKDVKAAQNNFYSCTRGIDNVKGDYTVGKNYDIFAFRDDNPYYYVLRVENTLYFCAAQPESITAVTDLLDRLGY